MSIQIISKETGRYQVVKTVGSSSDAQQIESLCGVARDMLVELTQQGRLNFEIEKERALADMFFTGIHEIRLMGPELLLGKLFDEIGFSSIKGKLFRSLVITRLVYPVSKLKTTDYWFKYNGTVVEVNRIYRYLDKLNTKHKELIQQISYRHTLQYWITASAWSSMT